MRWPPTYNPDGKRPTCSRRVGLCVAQRFLQLFAGKRTRASSSTTWRKVSFREWPFRLLLWKPRDVFCSLLQSRSSKRCNDFAQSRICHWPGTILFRTELRTARFVELRHERMSLKDTLNSPCSQGQCEYALLLLTDNFYTSVRRHPVAWIFHGMDF